MVFLRNTWYVAAWDNEVEADQILSRRLLNEPVILFRDENGLVRALDGICPHRMVSLSLGKLVGGTVQCGYHGLRFDGSGKCVHSSFGPPPKASVRSYPVIERYSAIWIWMGAPEAADPSMIPDFSFQDSDLAFVGKGYLNVKTNYELEIENILDLSHIEFLHPTTLGSDQVSTGKYQSLQDGETVWSNRDIEAELMVDEMCVKMGTEPGLPVDRWIHARWNAPANLAIFAGAVTAGRSKTEASGKGPSAHLFTPETDRSTHYWYSTTFSKSAGSDGARMVEDTIAYMTIPFQTEDLPMLENQQANIGDRTLRTLGLAWLPGDAAGARARKILYRKIDAESAEAALRSPEGPRRD